MNEKPLENKAFTITMWFVILMFAYGVSFRIYMQDYAMVLLESTGLIIVSSIYYLSNKRGLSKYLVFPLVTVVIIFNIYFWFYQGGVSGSGMMFFSTTIITIIIVSDRWINKLTITLLILQAVLVFLDKYYHHWSIWGVNHNLRFDYSLLFFIVTYLIWFLKRSYTKDKRKIKQFRLSLKELHKLNFTKTADLNLVLNEYLKTGADILKLETGIIVKLENKKHTVINVDTSQITIEQAKQFLSPYHGLLEDVRLSNKTQYFININNNKAKKEALSLIGTPILIEKDFHGILVFFSKSRENKPFEDTEAQILELMALNINHLISMQLWKENQKATEVALKVSETKFEGIFESADLGISVSDNKGKILMSNPALQRLLGYSEEELTDTFFYSYSHPEDLEEDLRMYEALIIGKISNYQIEKRVISKFGVVIDIWLTVSLTKLHGESERFVITLFDDISLRKKAESKVVLLNQKLEEQVDKLENANKELESFSYSVSHDLRAPLRAIDGFSEMLSEQYQDKLDDEGKRLLKVISNNSQKMSLLIDDLLAFSRVARKSAVFKLIDLQTLVNELIEELGFDKNIFEIQPLPEIKGEPTLIKQVYANLISNAVKFSSKSQSPKISVGVTDNETHHELYVEDNGVGFDMRYYDKLFDIFQRLHSERDFEGTGVGLAIVQKIITKHHGKIRAESQLDEGTIFYFTIPKSQ